MEPKRIDLSQTAVNENPLSFDRGFHEWATPEPLRRRKAANQPHEKPSMYPYVALTSATTEVQDGEA
jgi:hypothetical protein